LFYSGLMVALLSVRELTLPLLMDGGKTPVISTLVFQLQSNGNHDVAAAVAIYMIAILIVLVLLLSSVPRAGLRYEQAGRPEHRRAASSGRALARATSK